MLFVVCRVFVRCPLWLSVVVVWLLLVDVDVYRCCLCLIVDVSARSSLCVVGCLLSFITVWWYVLAFVYSCCCGVVLVVCSWLFVVCWRLVMCVRLLWVLLSLCVVRCMSLLCVLRCL